MAKILKPYVVALESKLAREILNIPLRATIEEEIRRPDATIGDRVAAAAKAVKEANEYLKESALGMLVADTLMRKLKKRGTPSLRVRPDGVVILHIAYDEEERPKTAPAAIRRSSRGLGLPKLDQLRKEAVAKGIDISDLGQKRRAIFERIRASEVRPPDRMVDETKESEAPSRPKTIRRPRKPVDGTTPSDEMDVEQLLG